MNAQPPVSVTVIIPTLAKATRRESLTRAIDCVVHQKGVTAIPFVVINGEEFDSKLRRDLESRTNIRVLYLVEGNLPEAHAAGVKNTETDFFSFLDDDDHYTPDALAHRLALMEASPAPDLVVTNFHIDRDGKRVIAHADFESCSQDPQLRIFEFAWLASLNGLYRTKSFVPEDFSENRKFMEWTSLAIRVACKKRIRFSNYPTAIYCVRDDSLSTRTEHIEAMLGLMRSVNRRAYPRETRHLIDRKCAAGLNMLAQNALKTGDRKSAWRHHLRCLVSRAGWRYLGATRKLL